MGTERIVRNAVIIVVIALAIGLALSARGLAGAVAGWITELRVQQGDAALESGNVVEAQREYELALALNPANAAAKTGLTRALYLRAKALFAASKLDDAHALITRAVKLGPDDPSVQALASEIEQARIRRDIVIGNYPTYGSTLTSIRALLKGLTASQKVIDLKLKDFSTTFDSATLVSATLEAYQLEEEAHRVTQRLISYREQVEGGANRAKPPADTAAPSLLPIP